MTTRESTKKTYVTYKTKSVICEHQHKMKNIKIKINKNKKDLQFFSYELHIIMRKWMF